MLYLFTTGNCAEAFVRLMILSGLRCRVGLNDVQSIVKRENLHFKRNNRLLVENQNKSAVVL